jgi:hypothetical protein
MMKFISGEKYGRPDPGHLIDCDAAPFTPTGWKVMRHKKGGYLDWDAAMVDLYFVGRGTASGPDLEKALADKPALNANVLDYLLARPELIPVSWRGKFVCFWGTVYLGTDRRPCVRCLSWGGGRWRASSRSLGNFWNSLFPAAVSAA